MKSSAADDSERKDCVVEPSTGMQFEIQAQRIHRDVQASSCRTRDLTAAVIQKSSYGRKRKYILEVLI